MNTRSRQLLSLCAALSVSMPALAQKGALQKLGKGEGQVDIVAWAGYIERGATD
jgi:putative spermidine/putrescine transport system substrate-binding protein